MSTAEPSLEPAVHQDWLERASDFLNPILVKETRQALKSRSFVSVFLLMLIASWLISSIGVLYAYGPELSYSAAGRGFFTAFYTVLSIAVFIVVPQGAFRSIQSERDLQTFEMLTITTLSPRKIVWGKWWSAAVQTIVYYAAIAPFMMFTNLLRGISLPFIAFVLIWSFVGSISLAMIAITFSTFTKQRQAFGLLQFLMVMPLVLSLIGLLQLMAAVNGELPFDEPYFWTAQLIIVSLLIPAFILFRQIATANLTFEGANRSTGIRISCFLLLVISLSWIGLLAHPGLLPTTWGVGSTSMRIDEVVAFITMISIWLWLVGLFTTTEDDRLSRRVRQEVPRRFLTRLLVLPFYPGGGRGFLYFVISALILMTVSVYLISVSTGAINLKVQSKTMVLAVVSYLFFYIGLTSFLGRAIRKIGSDLHAAHARVLGILITSTGVIGPFLFVFWDYQSLQTRPSLMITNPFYTCYKLIYESDSAPRMEAIVVLGTIGILLNLKNMYEGIREFLTTTVDVPTPVTAH